MAKSKKSESPADLAKNWQLCRTDKLPELFYAFDEAENQTERIVTFYLDKSQMEKVAKEIANTTSNYKLLVQLGLKSGYEGEFAPKEPYFQLMFQVYSQGSVAYEGSHILKWDPDPSFPTNPFESADSRVDAIPGQGAYLFVHHFLETPHVALGNMFEATAYQMGRRVKSFIFGVEESKAIASRINAHLQGKKPRLCIHLGKGITVATHPFSFRPVVEITSQEKTPDGKLVSTSDSNDFYDFSQPDPPFGPDPID